MAEVDSNAEKAKMNVASANYKEECIRKIRKLYVCPKEILVLFPD